MTAHKITIAVREHALVSKASYRQIFNRFTAVFLFCFFYFAYMMVIIPGTLLNGWPEYLYKIGSGLAFTFIMVLFIAFLQSFNEMKKALE